MYSVKLPGGEWLNLALIRRLQFQDAPPTAHITWENGDTNVYHQEKALAIVAAWDETQVIDKSHVQVPNSFA